MDRQPAAHPPRITKLLILALGVAIAIDLAAVFSTLLQIDLLNDMAAGAFPDAEAMTLAAEQNDERQQLAGIGQIVALIVYLVCFLFWVHAANTHVRQIGATGLRQTPGWAVGFYFIPFVNLWKPYQAMSDLWRASKAPEEWSPLKPGPLVILWWLTFLASSVIANISAKLMLRAEEVDELIGASQVIVFSDAFDIVSIVVTILLVKQIHAMQTALRPVTVVAGE